jgi:hypothetical protein
LHFQNRGQKAKTRLRSLSNSTRNHGLLEFENTGRCIHVHRVDKSERAKTGSSETLQTLIFKVLDDSEDEVRLLVNPGLRVRRRPPVEKLKRSGLDARPLTCQKKCQCAVSRSATRSSIHTCTSSETHVTRQAPSHTRWGNWAAASSRAMCANEYGTPKTDFNSFLFTSFCFIGHSLGKGASRCLPGTSKRQPNS